jgi:hypothetical protein
VTARNICKIPVNSGKLWKLSCCQNKIEWYSGCQIIPQILDSGKVCHIPEYSSTHLRICFCEPHNSRRLFFDAMSTLPTVWYYDRQCDVKTRKKVYGVYAYPSDFPPHTPTPHSSYYKEILLHQEHRKVSRLLEHPFTHLRVNIPVSNITFKKLGSMQ